jgi:acetyl-CoA/propionyl-CoA carboxylase biotin carboxyl carrier protein
MTPIRKLFIANRAEIALRIVRTARRMGISTVVPWHAADRDGPALREADENVQLFGEPPVAAFLDIAGIVRAARDSGCDAIHPGYGFLSENAAFARTAAEAGLVFVGPNAEVIERMGDKIRARRFAVEQGVPVTPAADEADDPASFAERARAVGFPLLVKGAAGGGGKGMQIVRDPVQLADAIAVARRESERYFGDGRLFAERFVERPRHIEVQVFGDTHGHVIHLGERECSIQRRFQKLIEETPAAGLDADLREFFFLEMNTRLQVEHPVTECVTGLDLVEWQLRVAAGEPLPLTQAQVRWHGHAIEARLLAEDADAGFVPDTGRVRRLRWAQGPGLRIDAGVTPGAPVTADFDSMLAKMVGHGATRALAISRLTQALQDSVLLGVTVNADYLARVLRHPAFQQGETDTGFLERHRDALRPAPLSDEQRRALLAVAARALSEPAARPVPEPYAAMGAWRN